ncbi:MAG: YCF48-related protein [Bryobacteraceae bacterium]|nr:YCF48-related protein [Bryobacteraceae bacterium]
MNRVPALFLLAASAAMRTLAAEETAPAAERFRPQFEFDQHDEALQLADFQFVSAQRGIAVGYRASARRNPEPVSLLTADGGKTWNFLKLPTNPYSVFFLDETVGWLVGEGGVYRTDEAGRSWKRLSKPRNVQRVLFVSPDRGWGYGTDKTVVQSSDGGQTWKPVEAAGQLPGKPEHSAFLSAASVDPSKVLIAGASRPPRAPERRRGRPPDPEEEMMMPEWPGLSLFLQTTDGGASWKHEAVSLFGLVQRIRYNAKGEGVWLLRFLRRFSVPSEVVRLDLGKKGESIFGQKDRAITDVAMMADGSTYLAGYQPSGSVASLPVPGKVKVLRNTAGSPKIWKEIPVHYRAVARQVLLSVVEPDQVWIATDNGMILKLQPAASQ